MHGRVRYYVEAEIDIPMAFDRSTILYFSVNQVHDLNMDQNAPVKPQNTS